MHLTVENRTISLDEDGYLEHLDDWSPEVACALAQEAGIELSDAHWEIIHLLRRFYEQFELSPAMRPLIKFISQELDKEKGRSIYLMQLFPDSPAKLAAKIAGLPRPENCL